MALLSGLKGMRHIALKVKNIKRSKAFYRDVLGMDLVWEPDAQNAYLSSGSDNLALHEIPAAEAAPKAQQLDHFGFVVESVKRVQELEHDFVRLGVKIVHPFKVHRDGSASFYCADPDGIIIQMLFEPTLSRQEIR
jgi:catechol 2,3-dioxygenase-like lactoylglutathione lyase family enzyme